LALDTRIPQKWAPVLRSECANQLPFRKPALRDNQLRIDR
jgi:hypothetical protein